MTRVDFEDDALGFKKISERHRSVNSANHNKRTCAQLLCCNGEREAVKAQVERLEGTTVTQKLKEQHCRNDLRWK